MCLYDRVMPFYESQGIPVEHILTDNGREYCGRPMIHPYQIFLEFSDIEHRRTKVAQATDQRLRGAIQPDRPR